MYPTIVLTSALDALDTFEAAPGVGGVSMVAE
jgi:hypothetical protein